MFRVIPRRHTTQPSRNLAGIELNVALAMPAKQQNGLVEQNSRAVGQGKKLRGHGQATRKLETESNNCCGV